MLSFGSSPRDGATTKKKGAFVASMPSGHDAWRRTVTAPWSKLEYWVSGGSFGLVCVAILIFARVKMHSVRG